MRVAFLMRCTVCNEENYLTEKNKKNTPDRLEQMKFCPKRRKQTLHREKTEKEKQDRISILLFSCETSPHPGKIYLFSTSHCYTMG